MFVIGIALVVLIVGCVLLFVKVEDKEIAVVLSFFLLLAVALPTYPIVGCAEGLIPDYSNGIREGYITKISKRGVFWKTWEGQLQIGAGEQAALQAPYEFSVSDDALAQKIEASLGKRVSMRYREWYVMPYRVGESGYEALSIELR